MNTSSGGDASFSIARMALTALMACLALYLLSPVLTAGHVEGFSAQIQSLALILWEQGSIAGHDLARPLVSDFIFLTRPGVVDLLAVGNALFGYRGDFAFRVLTVGSLALLLVASALFAKRQGKVPFWIGIFVCVLTPGLVELGFYFNDNIVSAAFAALALAAAAASSGTAAAALAGVLFGLAVLCRIDAVLAAPLLFLVFLIGQNKLSTGAGRLVLMGAVALGVHIIARRFNGGDLRDALQVTRLFTEIHLAGHGRLPGKPALQYFFGAIVPVLILLGARGFWPQRPAGWRGHAWVLAYYAYPLVLMVYVLLRTLEIRYFLPLLGPVVAMHAGRGWMVIRGWLFEGSRVQKLSAIWLSLAALLLLLAPPSFPLLRDGPRVFVGRFWSPPLWRDWQAAVASTLASTSQVVDRLSVAPVSTVITTHWNDEFYVRLRLFEAGFRELPAGSDCQPLSKYVHDSHVVWQVRMQPQYELPPFDAHMAGALPLMGVKGCAALQLSRAVWVTRFGVLSAWAKDNGFKDSDFSGPSEIVFAETLDETLRHVESPALRYPMFSATPMTIAHLDQLADNAAAYVDTQQVLLGSTSKDLMNRYEASFRRH